MCLGEREKNDDDEPSLPSTQVDLDLGNYERFLDLTLTRDNNLTTGKVYQHVLAKERKGDYLGKTVQVVPHVTDAIQDWIERVALIPVDGRPGPPDVCVIELGGTVGDIESAPFVEALRQFQFRVGAPNFCCVHVSLVPVLGVVGEQKTKPTQHSVATLRSLGINPAFLACRAAEPLEESVREKLALFCQVPSSHVLTMHDVANIWHVPLLLASQGAHAALCDRLGLGGAATMDLTYWRTALAERWDGLGAKVSVAMVGKYTGEKFGGGWDGLCVCGASLFLLTNFPTSPQACPTPTCPSSKPCSTPAWPPTGAWTWCGWTLKSWSRPQRRATATRRGRRSRAQTLSSSPAASARAVSKAKFWPPTTPEPRARPTWASAWACSWL